MAKAETFHPVSDKTARRVAEAVERYAGIDPELSGIKRFLDEHMLLVLRNAAVNYQDQYYGGWAGSLENYAYEDFDVAVKALDKHGISESYIALVNSDFVSLLMRETKFITDANISKVVDNGLIDRLAGVPLLKVSAKVMPEGCGFILMTAELYDLLYEMYRDGSILTDDNITELIFEHNREILVNSTLEELKFFDSESVESETKNKSILRVTSHQKEGSTNKFFYMTARNMPSLPIPEYGTPLSMSSATEPWYNSVEMTGTTIEITPPSTHKVYAIVETLSTLMPVGYSYGRLRINNG